MRTRSLVVAVSILGAVLAGASIAGAIPSPGAASAAFREPTKGYVVYWDQNEEEDYYASATNTQGQLFPAWDANGQMCIVNDGTGRWVVGYDPTLPSQHNPGGPPFKPYKQPPIGEELVSRTGVWTGSNLYVSGPYRMSAKDPGEDSPAVKGVYNGQSTYTGCAVDAHHNVFADDIGTGQGSFPIPPDGRLVEWFAPSYKQSCIVYGPDQGGVDGDHHVDGTDGLSQPGMMDVMPNGDLLLPQGGSPTGGIPGQVTRFDHTSLPTSASQCPGGVYPRSQVRTSTFFQGSGSFLPVPSGIATDPTCHCYAISSIFGDPSVAWVDGNGQPIASRPALTGEPLDQFGHDPTGYNPFGMAFAPDGTLYFVDIHITCQGAGLGNCGPENAHGQVMRVSFGPGEQPSVPQVLAGGFDFPTSATICVEGTGTRCPFPTHATPPPRPATAVASG
ncbi:MAG TPA: hypothetical protein VI462_17295 [Acidimicrobiia bacterium]